MDTDVYIYREGIFNSSNGLKVGKMGTSMLFKGVRDLVAIEERILKCIQM